MRSVWELNPQVLIVNKQKTHVGETSTSEESDCLEDFRAKGTDCRVAFHAGGCVEDDILAGLRRPIFFFTADGFLTTAAKGRLSMIDALGDVEVSADAP